jgi:hypothetical protein
MDIRIVLALQIHDAELSALLHREPLLKHGKSKHPSHAIYRSFEATSALSWASSARHHATSDTITVDTTGQADQRDLFTAYIKLQAIGVNIGEDRRQDELDQDTINDHHEKLLAWHETYAESVEQEESDHLCLLALWHWTYMTLLVDLNKLEAAIGRDGPDAAQEAVSYVIDWASTPESSRCIMHALLLQKQIQFLRFQQTPAIHIPRIIFSASVAWHCYIKYGPGNDTPNAETTMFDTSYPEFKAGGPKVLKRLSAITHWSRHQGAISCIKAATLCELGGLLHRMNEWGLAGTLAKVVARLIDDEA